MPLKEAFIPAIGKTIKFGYRPQPHLRKALALNFADYLHAGALPTPPDHMDYSAKAAKSLATMLGNDGAGDCVPAGGLHQQGVVTANAGGEVVYTAAEALHLYSVLTGYDPHRPETDQGTDPEVMFDYLVRTGFPRPPGAKILGWLKIDHRDPAQVRTALWLFETLGAAAYLPPEWHADPRPGFVWDVGTPDPEAGHYFICPAYGPSGLTVSTWGMLGSITNAAVARNLDALYVMLDPQMIARAQQKAPSGLDWADLVNDFNALGGHVTPPDNPPPLPPEPPNVNVKQLFDNAVTAFENSLPGLAGILARPVIEQFRAFIDAWLVQHGLGDKTVS